MLTPDLHIGEWGLKRYKDGPPQLCKQHRCGDWQTIRNATQDELDKFGIYGRKPIKCDTPTTR